MGVNIVEDESHALFQCDLYARQRSKLIKSINSATQITRSEQDQSPTNLNIDQVTASNLESYLMAILSPNVTQSNSKIRETAQKIHNEILDSSQHDENTLTQLKFRQSYTSNCVCTFILRCTEARKNFIDSLRANNNQLLNIEINLTRNP